MTTQAIALNMDKMKAKYEELSNEENNKNSSSLEFCRSVKWNAPIGESIIRILPPWTTEGPNAFMFYKEQWSHFSMGPKGDKHFSCGRQIGKPCFFCDQWDKLKKGSPEDQELAKSFWIKRRNYSNILVFDKNEKVICWEEKDIPEDSGIRVGEPKIFLWGFAKKVRMSLLNIIMKPRYGDITHAKEGLTIALTRIGKDRNNTEYTILPVEKFPLDQEVLDSLYGNSIYNLDFIYPPVAYEVQEAAHLGLTTEEFVSQLDTSERGQLAKGTAARTREPTEHDDFDDSGDIEAELRGGLK